MKLGVFGAGYVGLVTGACFASLGHDVVCHDRDRAKIAALRAGRAPFHEPGLPELLARCGERLRFSSEPAAAVRGRQVTFIAVGTPSGADGRADLSAVCAAARSIAVAANGPLVVANKSTVPAQTADVVEDIVRGTSRQLGVRVVSNPEFLREGCAIEDFFHPDRIVLGCDDPWAEHVMRRLYAELDAPLVVTDRCSAELIKYAANALLATKISFANELAAICERVGGDVDTVVHGVGLDRRIGPHYLEAGLGFGGSCLPKDVRALAATAERVGVDATLLAAVLRVNDAQVERVVGRLDYVLGGLRRRHVAVLGVTFKPDTDDVRESPAVALLQALAAAGAEVTVHDPIAAQATVVAAGAVPCATPEECVRAAEAVVLATAWPVYRELDPVLLGALMRRRIVFDMRHALDAAAWADAGFLYHGVGAPGRPYALAVGARA